MTKKQNKTVIDKKTLQMRYKGVRIFLLLLVGVSLLNVITILLGTEYNLLFSASVPFFLALFSRGMYEATLHTPILIVGGIAAVLVVSFYFLAWIFSKKNYIWFTITLFVFIADTLILIGLGAYYGDITVIIDTMLHVWIIISLWLGAKWGKQLKNMPEEIAADSQGDNENAI